MLVGLRRHVSSMSDVKDYIAAVPYVCGLTDCLLTSWTQSGTVTAEIYFSNCTVIVLY